MPPMSLLTLLRVEGAGTDGSVEGGERATDPYEPRPQRLDRHFAFLSADDEAGGATAETFKQCGHCGIAQQCRQDGHADGGGALVVDAESGPRDRFTRRRRRFPRHRGRAAFDLDSAGDGTGAELLDERSSRHWPELRVKRFFSRGVQATHVPHLKACGHVLWTSSARVRHVFWTLQLPS